MYEYENNNPRDNENNLEEIAQSEKNEDELNLTNLHMEYDECINELKKQLAIAKELRKKSEVDKTALEHRIFLLKNQEKYVLLQNLKRTVCLYILLEFQPVHLTLKLLFQMKLLLMI